MKKLFTYILAGLSLVLFSRCDALDLEPVSSIADNNYWKSEAQFSTFNVGLHALLRECSYNFFLLGEPRADIYGDLPFGGEATQGMEY
ncbi:MAG: SusD family outer membrane lipoprotein NanU, partial [Bacteroides sp.]